MKIKDIIPEYLTYMKIMNLSPYTIRDAKYTLRKFVKYLDGEKVITIEDLTRDVLTDYQQELAFTLTARGRPLAIRTQTKRMGVLRGLTRYLYEKDYLVHDPGALIKMPKEPKMLPRVIMTTSEINKILSAPDMQTNRGYRNRVILEILYDTAIRRLEVCNINLSDIDLEDGYIRITGKGDKQRVVPVSDRVCMMLKSYIRSVRQTFLTAGKSCDSLFLNRWGETIGPNAVWAVVKRSVHLAGIKRNIHTHTFRHSCATHMLKNGAPIRHIQELLGHESLESTQIYTKVTINDLKKAHSKYHPGEHEEV